MIFNLKDELLKIRSMITNAKQKLDNLKSNPNSSPFLKKQLSSKIQRMEIENKKIVRNNSIDKDLIFK